MPTYRIEPPADEDPGSVLQTFLNHLEVKGETLIAIVDLPQQLPRQGHWLVVTAKKKVERR